MTGKFSISSLLSFFLDLVFPPKCLSCGRFGPGPICPSCLNEFPPYRGKTCSLCGVPYEGVHDLCSDCRREAPLFERAIFHSLYEGKMEEMILRFKFGNCPQLSLPFAQLMASLFNEKKIKVDLVTAVPLAQRRWRSRGYNQAQLLATQMASSLALPYRDTLVRLRETKAQAKLSREQRLLNVVGAFRVNAESIAGKKILLVDDVYTTGATVKECSRILLKAGAQAIVVFTLARGTGTQRTIS